MRGGTVPEGTVVIIGGTSGIGRTLAEHYAARGRAVVVAGRDAARAQKVAGEIGGGTTGLAADLAQPGGIAAALAGVSDVEHLVLAAIDRDDNRAREFDLDGALRLVTMKLVGYTEAIHALLPRMREHASILLFGGLAKDRPYPGSTTVTTVNGGITGMVHTLATELAPIRVNALHPGIVGDSPAWAGKPPAVLEAVRARTPLGRLITMSEVAGAAAFLLENGAVNGVNLAVDGGWLLM
jgi:NAD(P)-dependent dehydrogenase (short-subunit alcohol dehydrogenase family)